MESFTIGSMMIAELCKYAKNYWDDFLEWMNTWMNVWYANNISTNLFLRIITELSTLYGFIRVSEFLLYLRYIFSMLIFNHGMKFV